MGSYSSGEWVGGNSWCRGWLSASWKSNGSAANSSNVTVTLYARRDTASGNSFNYSVSNNFWIQCNGTTRYSTCQQVAGTSWTTVASSTFTVGHNNDGSKSITIAGGGSIPGTTFSIGSKSATITLDKIPRYTSITTWVITDNSITQTSASFDWKVADDIKALEYCFNDSNSWISSSFSGKSGSFTCDNLEPGITYKIKLRVTRKDSGLTTTSNNIEFSTVSITTLDISNLVDDSGNFEFDIGKDLKFKIKDIDNNSYFIRFYIEDDSGGWKFLLGENPVKFTENQAENYWYYVFPISGKANDLYKNCITSNSKKFRIEFGTIINEKEYLHTYEGIFNVTNSNPTFGGFSLVNNNTKINTLFTINETPHPEYGVFGYVDESSLISSSDRANGANYATIYQYHVDVKVNSTGLIYSSTVSNSSIPSTGSFSFVLTNVNNIGTYDISIWAEDSRGNLSPKYTKTFTVLPYSSPTTYNISLSRLNSYERQIILNFSSDYTKLNVNGVQKNRILNIQYQYALYSDDYGEIYTFAKNSDGTLANFSYTTSDNSSVINLSRIMDETHGGYFVGNNDSLETPDGFKSEENYKVKFIITDEISTSTVEIQVPTGIPIMFRGSNGQVAIGKSPNEVFKSQEKFQVDGDIRFDYSGNRNTNITDILKQMIVVTDSTGGHGTIEPENQPEGFLWFEVVDKIDIN